MKEKEKTFQRTSRKEKGITLVALVITIVIIVILSSVTLMATFGDNGIIKQAELARDLASNSTIKEAEDMNSMVDGYGNIISEGEKPGPVPPKDVPIPDGFVYVGGTKEEGVVISDNPADEGKGTDHNTAQNVLQGNQFVWVPVEDGKFERYEGYRNGAKQSYLSSSSEPYTNGSATEKSEYEAMKASVLEHNGFYVGRYETGTNTKRTDNSGITDEAVIKQGKNVYNYIGWSNSEDMTNEKGGAVEKAKNFGKEHGYEEKSSVTSTLVYGIQWDAIMNFIDPAYATGSCDTSKSFLTNSTEKGWYNQSAPAITGSNASYAVKNIYDLGGNVEEWTMEAEDIDRRVRRGRCLPQFGF